MGQKTRDEVLEKLRPRYARAGKEHKGKIIDEVVQLFGYHSKAALRALRLKERPSVPHVIGPAKGVRFGEAGRAAENDLAGRHATVWRTAQGRAA